MSLEADLVEKDWSVFANHVGDVVASPLVTLVDDGSYAASGGRSRSTTRARRHSATC